MGAIEIPGEPFPADKPAKAMSAQFAIFLNKMAAKQLF